VQEWRFNVWDLNAADTNSRRLDSLEALPVKVHSDPEGLQRLFVEAPELDTQFEVYGSCPVQALGTVLGRDLFFHARHDGWTFDIADHAGNLPSDGFRDSDGFYREGEYSNAGWMPLARDGMTPGCNV
jgi:hypothetical protein